jgi:hypothetical protein
MLFALFAGGPVSALRRFAMSSQTEKRLNERQTCAFSAGFNVLAAEEVVWEGIVRDVSETGVGLEAPRGFPTGTLLAFQFETVTLLSVVHQRQAERGWFLGCRFLRPLDSAQVQTIAGRQPSALAH